MFLFGLSSSAAHMPRAIISLLALSSSSSSSSSSGNNNSNNNNKAATSSTTSSSSSSSSAATTINPAVMTAWEELVNQRICSALEKQFFFEDYYENVLGNPSWNLDLDPVSGNCLLTFTTEQQSTGRDENNNNNNNNNVVGSNTKKKVQCQLVGSESHSAQSFLWAIPQDPTKGIPNALLSYNDNNDKRISQDIQNAVIQTRKEIPMSPTLNGYSISLVAGSLLETPAKAVFLGPYGEDTGILYLLITDDDFPTIESSSSSSSTTTTTTTTTPTTTSALGKIDRLKTFAKMVTSVPFITNHKTAFQAFVNDLGGLTTRTIGDSDEVKLEIIDETVSADASSSSSSSSSSSIVAQFDVTGMRMTQLGDLLLLTTEEVQKLQQQQQTAAQQPTQQQQEEQQKEQQQQQKELQQAKEKAATLTGQLQLDFFQKLLDESITSQRQLFIDCATKIGLQVTEKPDPENDNTPLVEAYDPQTGDAMLGHFDHDDRMTRLGNIKKD